MGAIVVHDHCKSYCCVKNVLHTLCNQHHLRELKPVIEFDQEKCARKIKRYQISKSTKQWMKVINEVIES